MKLLQLSRSDRVLLGVLLPLSLLGALITWLVMPPKKEGSWLRQPSSFFNSGSGAKVAYLVLERLGYQVSRLRQPISRETLQDVDALFILEPVVPYERDERKALSDWIRAGNCLVLAPGVRSFGPVLPGNWFFDNWISVGPPVTASAEVSEEVSLVIGESLKSYDSMCAGIGEMSGRTDFRFPSGSVVKGQLSGLPVDEIWRDEYGVGAARVRYGDGEIIAQADTYWMSNRGLDKADNSLFLANIAAEATRGNRSGRIAFDEMHHGFKLSSYPEVAVAKLMLQEHWGWGLVQAALVTVVGLFAASVRFGKPRDIILQSRRQHGEFAEAAGRTLYDANATGLAYSTLYHHYRIRLCKAMHLSIEASVSELAGAVSARTGQDISELLNAASEKVRAGGASRVDLLDLVNQLHRLLEDIEHVA